MPIYLKQVKAADVNPPILCSEIQTRHVNMDAVLFYSKVNF